jgi:hypothetical protein
MRFITIILLLLSAHFALTPFAPGPAGTAKFYWPFAADSRSWLGFAGGLPAQSGALTAILAGLAGLGFLVAAIGIIWNFIPASWWPILITIAAISSILLYVLYFGIWAILPLALDLVLLWGILLRHWTLAGLRGN